MSSSQVKMFGHVHKLDDNYNNCNISHNNCNYFLLFSILIDLPVIKMHDSLSWNYR